MLKDLRRLIRNFFGFSYGEAKGFLLLLFLLLALCLAYLVYRSLPDRGYTSYAEDKVLLDSLLRKMERQKAESLPELTYDAAEERLPPELFSFDPNLLPADSLALLGLPQWLASRIDKYRQKGGAFRKKEDLRKIYGLTDSMYRQLAPFIEIHKGAGIGSTTARTPLPEGRQPERGFAVPEKKAFEKLDINKADSFELQVVKGVGPVLSGRIVRFRQKLGGFVSLNQLNEVWGLDSAVLIRLREQVFVEEGYRPVLLKINSATQEEMAGHPYISPVQARLLHAYRQQHGPFQSTDELVKIHTLSADFVKKIAPYIEFE